MPSRDEGEEGTYAGPSRNVAGCGLTSDRFDNLDGLPCPKVGTVRGASFVLRRRRVASTRMNRRSHASETIDAQRLRAWRAFLEAHATVTERLERELREERDLPLAWYDVLVQLVEADGHELRMQELADAVLLSKSGLTRLIDRMEQAGLVARRPCELDRRGTYARLTDEGIATLRSSAPTHLRGVAEHFASHLDDEEARILVTALERIAAATDRAGQATDGAADRDC